ETTPHMHLGIVPFDKENKLSAKRVFDRKTLQKIQDELPKYLKERNFDLTRGEKGSDRKHLSVPEYKKVQKEIEELNLKHEITKEKIEKQKTGNVVMPINKYRELQKMAEKNLEVEKQVNEFMKTDLVQENKKLKEDYNNLNNKYNHVVDYVIHFKNQTEDLEREIDNLKEEIQEIYKEVKTIFVEKMQVPEYLHEVFSNLKERFENSRFANLFVQDKKEETK